MAALGLLFSIESSSPLVVQSRTSVKIRFPISISYQLSVISYQFISLLDSGKSKEPLSPGSFGWGGAYCTYFFVDPTEELIGVFMTQMTP